MLFIYIFLLVWICAANSLLLPHNCRPFAATMPGFAASLLLRLGLIFALGYGLDTHLTAKPHSAYITWELYAIFLSLTLIWMIPGFIFKYYKQKDISNT